MKTNSAQFNIIFDTALRSLGGRDWYQMLWYGFLKDRLHSLGVSLKTAGGNFGMGAGVPQNRI